MDIPVPRPSKRSSMNWRLVIGILLFLGIIFFGVWWVKQPAPSGPSGNSGRFTSAGGQSAQPTTVDKTRLVRDTSPSLGSADAAITIVEFSDFECPYCQESYPIIRSLAAEFGDRIHYVYRHFPVPSLHEHAQAAAEAAACAQEQDKFWPYHDRLFQNQDRLDADSLRTYAQSVGLNMGRFDVCVNSHRYADVVSADIADGQALGVRGTPTWFINGLRVEGAIPADRFRKAIESLLAAN